MARDPIEDRFTKRQDRRLLDERGKRTRRKEDVEAEEELHRPVRDVLLRADALGLGPRSKSRA